MPKVKIACEGAELANVVELEPLQGELKSLSEEAYAKLRKEIETTGLAFPFRVWKNKGKLKIVGGHQTQRVLLKMQADGWEIPKVPVSFIHAKSEAEAKRRVLQDISTYGQVDKDKLYEFMGEFDMGIDDLVESFEIPDVDLESFKFEFFTEQASTGSPTEKDVDTTAKQYDTYLQNNIKQVVMYVKAEDFEALINRLNMKLVKYNLDDYTQLLMRLMDEDDQSSSKNG